MHNFCAFMVLFFSIWLNLGYGHATEGVHFFNFLTSASSTRDDQRISFGPDDGKKFRRSFEQKYGPRAKMLIDSMGQGSTTSVPRIDKNKGNGTKHILKKKIIKPITISIPSLSTSPSSVTSKSTASSA